MNYIGPVHLAIDHHVSFVPAKQSRWHLYATPNRDILRQNATPTLTTLHSLFIMSDIFIIRAIGKARPATPYDGELLHPLRFRYTGRDHFPRSSIRLGDWVFLMCDRATTLWRGPPYETFPAEKFQVVEVEREIRPGVS